MKKLVAILFVSGALGAAQAGPQTEDQTFDPWEKRINADGVLELDWDDLLPPDFTPEKLFKKYDVGDLDDNDPKAQAAYEELQATLRNAPAVESLNGRHVKLPGFVVPLEGDGTAVREFLLVPYFGACIHSPPPPSNQIVHVKVGEDAAEVRQMFDAVWVSGRLVTEYLDNDVGSASYTLDAERIEPYE